MISTETAVVIPTVVTAIQKPVWYAVLPIWLNAIATYVTVTVTLLLVRGKFYPKPAINVSLDDPRCFRETRVSTGKGFWIRLKVKNHGRATAHKCYGTISAIYDKDSKPLDDRDPMHLRWAGYPQTIKIRQRKEDAWKTENEINIPLAAKYMGGFEPIQIAVGQYAFINVFLIEELRAAYPINIVTFPDCDWGFIPALKANEEYTLAISIFAENVKNPAQVKMKIKYDGNYKVQENRLEGLSAELL